MTNVNITEKGLRGEQPITHEHIENNLAVRGALGDRNIKPEYLPASEDLQKVKRKLDGENKKILKQIKSDQKKLPKKK